MENRRRDEVAASSSVRRSRGAWLRAALALLALWSVVFAGYRLTERRLKIIDVEAVIRIPISLWNDGDLYLDEYLSVVPKVLIPTRGERVVSLFPIWPALHLIPVYFAIGLRTGHFPDESNVWAAQRRTAQLSMATATLLVAMTTARRHGWWIALLTAVAFGFGTINWFHLSQLSFSNGLVQLWLALALYCGAREPLRSRALATVSLLAMVVAVFYRLSLAPVAGVWALYVLWRLRRAAVLPLIAATALFVAMAACNQAYAGHPLGFYGQEASHLDFPPPTFGEALYGNLLSPARGILVFSPWILFACGAFMPLRAADRVLPWALLSGCFVHYMITSSHWHWYGGGSLGPRLTADVLPLWAVLAAAGFARLASRPFLMALPVAAVAASTVIAGAHAFSDSWRWPGTPVHLSAVTAERLFDWRDALVAYPFRKTPYEERYPIRPRTPAPYERTTAAELTFTWEVPPGPEASELRDADLVLRLAVWFRGGVEQWDLAAPLGDRITVAAADLPPRYFPTVRMGWRVVARDDRGKQIARSGWRAVNWNPEIPTPESASAGSGVR